MTPEMKKLIVAPLMGGMLVLFLPIIVWPLLAQALWVHFSPRLKTLFHIAPVTPGVAYFAGEGKEGKPTANEKLDKLSEEIRNKR